MTFKRILPTRRPAAATFPSCWPWENCLRRKNVDCQDPDSAGALRSLADGATLAQNHAYVDSFHSASTSKGKTTHRYSYVNSNMEDHDMEEEELDIAAAMGFGAFGGTKKRKYDHSNSPRTKVDASGANSTQLGMRTKKAVAQETPEAQGADGTTSRTDEASNDAKPQAPAQGLAQFLARGQSLPIKPPNASQVGSSAHQDDSSTVKTVSFGGPPISTAELNALRFGIKNESGDTAYFLPNFVEDPWEELKRVK